MPSEPARFLEDFGGNGALHRSIRFPADAVFRIIPPLRARGSVWRICSHENRALSNPPALACTRFRLARLPSRVTL